MTIDEAIKQTENVICVSRMLGYYGSVFQTNTDYWETILNALRSKQENDEIKILSAIELNRMDGCPVWVSSLTREFSPCWMLVNAREGKVVTEDEYLEISSCGESWVAYSRAPAR